MGIFQPVKLTWNDIEYTVPANQVMGLIAQIEDVVTLAELLNKKGAPMGKVAMAYGNALRYAGAKVADEEVYKGMFSQDASNVVQAAVAGLLSMMIPPTEVVTKGPKKPRKQVGKSS